MYGERRCHDVMGGNVPAVREASHTFARVLADAYIHELGEVEARVGALMDNGGPR